MGSAAFKAAASALHHASANCVGHKGDNTINCIPIKRAGWETLQPELDAAGMQLPVTLPLQNQPDETSGAAAATRKVVWTLAPDVASEHGHLPNDFAAHLHQAYGDGAYLSVSSLGTARKGDAFLVAPKVLMLLTDPKLLPAYMAASCLARGTTNNYERNIIRLTDCPTTHLELLAFTVMTNAFFLPLLAQKTWWTSRDEVRMHARAPLCCSCWQT